MFIEETFHKKSLLIHWRVVHSEININKGMQYRKDDSEPFRQLNIKLNEWSELKRIYKDFGARSRYLRQG